MRYFRNDQVTFPGDLSERMFLGLSVSQIKWPFPQVIMYV